MSDAQVDLVRSQKAIRERHLESTTHRHRNGRVLQVYDTDPKCDVMLNPSDEVHGVAFDGTAPIVGDPVEVVVEPDGRMRITANRAVNTNTVTTIITPGVGPPSGEIQPVERIFGNEFNADGSTDRPYASADLRGWAFEALDTGREDICNGSSWVQISAGIADPPRQHGPEAHTDEVGTGTGDEDPTQGDPTQVFWAPTRADLPPINSTLRRSLYVVMEDDDVDSPVFGAFNGESNVDLAMLNAAPRQHGDEAHLLAGAAPSSGTRLSVIKDFDEAAPGAPGRTPSTTYLDDAELSFPIEEDEQWHWDLYLYYDGIVTNGQGDIGWGMKAPAGSAGRYGYAPGPENGATGIASAAGYLPRAGSTTDYAGLAPIFTNGTVGVGTVIPIHAWGFVRAGNNVSNPGTYPGNVKLKWAQRQASATPTTVKFYSMLIAELVP